MRTIALVVGLALAGTTAASAAPRHSDHASVRAMSAKPDLSPRTTGSLGAPAAQSFGPFGDPATWGRRGPGVPSPINPLGYTGE